MAEQTPIPDLQFMAGPGSGYKTVHNYIPARFSADILSDNLMDSSHFGIPAQGLILGGLRLAVDHKGRRRR
jgi:hypothetical protein